jgi:uncharacterized tellurite resistance protein B-like protein
MIKRIVESVVTAFKSTNAPESETSDRESALRLATAVLMVEVARADHVFEQSEFERLLDLIASHFELSPEDAADLVDRASETTDDVVHLHDFTQLLHKHLTEAEKARIVGLLWQVAYADGRLDKYEDSLVLKISDLLFVSRGRVMRLKHDAELIAND